MNNNYMKDYLESEYECIAEWIDGKKIFSKPGLNTDFNTYRHYRKDCNQYVPLRTDKELNIGV